MQKKKEYLNENDRKLNEQERVAAENPRNDSYKLAETNRENTFMENESRR